jgi:hypothetical protein
MTTSGGQRMLNVSPQSLHQRSAPFIMFKNMTKELESLIHSKVQASPDLFLMVRHRTKGLSRSG